MLIFKADVLDDFSPSKNETTEPTSTASGPDRPASSAQAPTALPPLPTGAPTGLSTEDDDFENQMQAGMAELLSEMEKDPQMQQEFERLTKDLMGAALAADDPNVSASAENKAEQKAAASAAHATKQAEDTFQEQIRRTMERMQSSSDSASAAAKEGGGADDILAQMLKEMESGNFDPEKGLGGGGDEDFSKMLMGMMEQLTNKEILYEPMKELSDKFPGWMEKNAENTQKEDLERYREQQRLVGEIVGKFEEKGYKDENAGDREFIVERMQKVGSDHQTL